MNLTLSFDDIKDVVKQKGYQWWQGKNNLFLYGIRSRSLLVNLWNDVLGVCYIDHFGNKINLMHQGTTKPGLNWLKEKKGNPNGTAILIPGQYRRSLKLGMHNGYVALQQAGPGVFDVWRDNNQDGRFDYQGAVYKDVTGLNMHAESLLTNADKVGWYSAGCQVRAFDHEHFMVMSLCSLYAQQYNNPFLSYTLLEERDFLPKFADVKVP